MRYRFLSSISILCCTIFLTSCSNESSISLSSKSSERALKQISNAEYLVSYTNGLKPGGYLTTYDKEGNVLEKASIEGQSIITNAKDEDTYYFSSSRNDKHYSVTKQGQVEAISKPKNLQNTNSGAYFIHAEQGYVFYDMNIGILNEKDGYISELVYKKKGETQQHIKLKGTIQGAHIINNTLYAFSQTDQKVYISYIDLSTDKLLKEVEIPNQDVLFASSFHKSMFQIWNDKIVLSLSDNVDQKLPTRLVIINPNNGSIEKEILLNSTQSIPIHLEVINNELYIFEQTGNIQALNTNYKTIKTYSIQETSAFFNKLDQKGGGIADIQIEKKKIYILYQYTDKSARKEKVRGEIHSYSLEDGKKLDETTLMFNKHWEDITFLVIDSDK
ncbi:hypothetical protein [Ectobacillus antri]|uniref:hypothetical protein n=1 Tax=Ectobacillus antri TaxID=2486280 RepID=UPI001FE9D2A8|nr:hypothetical protein [Ectobacillus antri]